MKRIFIYKFLTLFFVFQVVSYKILAKFPWVVEQYYSSFLFIKISSVERWFFNLFSISIGDMMYAFLFLYIIYGLWNTRKNWKTQPKIQLYKIGSFVSIIYLIFMMCWGLNYSRVPMHEKLNIKKNYTTQQLVALTYQLINNVNFLQQKITQTDTLPVPNKQSISELLKQAERTFQNSSFLTQTKAEVAYKIKSSLYSTPLSYMGFGGYLNPFTNEAHINTNVPKYTLPTIALHELSHQYGIASESEANFIGYILSLESDDWVWQYSGSCYALKYCLNTLEKKQKGSSKKYLTLLNPGVLENFKETERYNKKYDSSVEIVFKTFYDNYLKINAQKDGLQEYNKFLGLIINYNNSERNKP